MKGLTVSQIKNTKPGAAEGAFVDFSGESFYRISNYDAMPAFFMTIVSSSDVWNYLWSNGGLTAGRINCDHALFPYYTADKVSDSRTYTGPYSAVKVSTGNDIWLWEPFSEATAGLWKTERNLYKNTSGSKVYFEEINHDLELTFRYGWTSSDAFGLVRHVSVINNGKNEAKIEILDGCRNILPACVTSAFQNDNSVLLDAYKKTDLDTSSGIAVFSVTSIVTDKAEPSEGLFANVSWFSCDGDIRLSPEAPEAFRSGDPIPADTVIKGKRPAFYIHRTITLAAAGQKDADSQWYQIFDTSLDLTRIVDLKKKITNRMAVTKELEADIASGIKQLEDYIAAADGMQDTADRETCVHHEANVMFNIMRGGIPAENDLIETADLIAFTKVRNTVLVGKMKKAVASLPAKSTYTDIRDAAEKTGDAQVIRMFREYLPLTFSRRHGDPSRPWNRFSIELKDAAGNRKLNYQGNWRDIFQNWEALALSWPQYLENMTAKFLNAATADGFNPYRITRDGIDWEAPDPGNPWSNIGYWGDHQVIYLAKLLELQNKFDRAGLLADLDKQCYSSGNVPYHLKPYAEIVKNPRSTIVFDYELDKAIEKKAHETGSDAKLLQTSGGDVALVSMTAKLLPIVLAKMSNLVPGGGIWLNTQRPEWNDANNALAGYGLSMVTLYYLRRFMVFLEDVYANTPVSSFTIPEETAEFFTSLAGLYRDTDPASLGTPKARRSFMDKTGLMFEKQRESIYAHGYSTKSRAVTARDIKEGLAAFLAHAEATIKLNRREDGLYHAYNTMTVEQDGGMSVHYLTEMLEGQVAVLSSGYLSGKETAALCRELKTSKLFRADQYSYILYPDKELPHFCAKNIADAKEARKIPLLAAMLDAKDGSLAHIDAEGIFHFNPSFRNARGIDDAIATIRKAGSYPAKTIDESERAIHELYEKTFNHQSFTGRSGTFYAYEGLGSIYWHMVAKLMLAVQEKCIAEKDPSVRTELTEIYYDIRKGIGFNKTPAVYGAFPTDPYSHTPAGQGAKQPGMTGQVKEEIITRWGELGLVIDNGTVSINPLILRKEEFHEDGHLSFTWCGTSFVYRLAEKGAKPSIAVTTAQGNATRDGTELTAAESKDLFARNGKIRNVEVRVTL